MKKGIKKGIIIGAGILTATTMTVLLAQPVWKDKIDNQDLVKTEISGLSSNEIEKLNSINEPITLYKKINENEGIGDGMENIEEIKSEEIFDPGETKTFYYKGEIDKNFINTNNAEWDVVASYYGSFRKTVIKITAPKKLSSEILIDGEKYKFEVKAELYEDAELKNIVKNDDYFDNKVDQIATLLIKEESKNGKDYEKYTNKNIYLKLNNDAKDSAGIKNSYFYINDGSNMNYTNEIGKIIDKQGLYNIVSVTEDNLGNVGKKEYKVKIDRASPKITINSKDSMRKEIVIKESEDFDSGIEDSVRYFWTKNPSLQKNDINKLDFYGAGEGIYRGNIKVISDEEEEVKEVNVDIQYPKEEGYSGGWYLWIYAEDKVGNIIIEGESLGQSQGVDDEKPIPGEIIARYDDNDDNSEYKMEVTDNGTKEGNYTNKNITVELTNGYDSFSTIASNNAEIKNGRTVLKTISTGEKFTIENDGIYEITVTTKDIKGKTSNAVYIIKIDKKTPNATANTKDNYKINSYAKKHTIQVSVSDTSSGIDGNKFKYQWLEESKVKINSKGKVVLSEEQKNDIKNKGIVCESEKDIITPKDVTGTYCFAIYVVDNCGNELYKAVSGFKLDNSNPTKPDIMGYSKEIIGTKEEKIKYYGSSISNEVMVVAYESMSESGVDKYQYQKTIDNGINWTEWTDCTSKKTNEETKEEVIYGLINVKNNGKTVIKFRSVSVVEDGELYSEESEEFIVNQDIVAPTVTFANTENGENGQKEKVENIKVNVTVTDNTAVNENTLKYAWVKFESEEAFDKFAKEENTNEKLEQMMKEEKLFTNGSSIPSKDGFDGIYSLFVKAEDIFGNKTILYSNSYFFGTVITNYEYENRYIKKISPNTNVETFINNVKVKIVAKEYKVYDKFGKELSKDKLVTTSSILVIDGKERYTIIVNGDTNEDGKITISDLVLANKHLVKEKMLDGTKLMAADVNSDNKITISDVVKINKVILKIIEL